MTLSAATVFAALALVLSGPVPALLARASWPLAHPRPALVLWQCVALAAVLSVLGAGLAVASDPLVAEGAGQLRVVLAVLVLGLTAVVAVRLVWGVVQVARMTRHRRAAHRTLVDVLTRPVVGDGLRSGLRILEGDQPLAYCLPGRRGRVVVTEGVLASLGEDELDALLEHEHAHLRARHDLLLEAFTGLHRAFPRIVRSAAALDQARLLVEALADDAAGRRAGREPLARALVACAGAAAPGGSLAAGGDHTLLRVERLVRPAAVRPWLAACVYTASAAVLVLPTWAVALPWLTRIGSALG